MALTAVGAALTAGYQRHISAMAAATGLAVADAMGDIDPADIGGAHQYAVKKAADAIQAGTRQGRALTAQYLSRYARAEDIDLSPLPAVRPIGRQDAVRTAFYSGPVRAKTLIRRGISGEQAVAEMRDWAAQWGRTRVESTARDYVIQSARHTRLKCRRVTVGKTCAFCSMLAARGPVYTEDTVTFRAHRCCDCTWEICKETPAEWLKRSATSRELRVNAAYQEAAANIHASGEALSGRPGRHNITMEMRRVAPELFSDGWKTR